MAAKASWHRNYVTVTLRIALQTLVPTEKNRSDVLKTMYGTHKKNANLQEILGRNCVICSERALTFIVS